MKSRVHLITGIPRSGTTLSCKLLNQRSDVVALHEPINPNSLPQTKTIDTAVAIIKGQIVTLDNAIEQGLSFAHGDKGGLAIENPVGLVAKDGVRLVVAQRGEIQLPARDKNSYRLVIKQNALFTALIPELSMHYAMVCIVRNPIDVFLSWLTVDLPINRGHIPAAEKFDTNLKFSLEGLNCLQRQLAIYQWFINQFLQSGLPIVRYEDVIKTSGHVLDEALGFETIKREKLSLQVRGFTSEIVHKLLSIESELINLQCGNLYSKEYIISAINNIKVS